MRQSRIFDSFETAGGIVTVVKSVHVSKADLLLGDQFIEDGIRACSGGHFVPASASDRHILVNLKVVKRHSGRVAARTAAYGCRVELIE
jgi:hypothetical protein